VMRARVWRSDPTLPARGDAAVVAMVVSRRAATGAGRGARAEKTRERPTSSGRL